MTDEQREVIVDMLNTLYPKGHFIITGPNQISGCWGIGLDSGYDIDTFTDVEALKYLRTSHDRVEADYKDHTQRYIAFMKTFILNADLTGIKSKKDILAFHEAELTKRIEALKSKPLIRGASTAGLEHRKKINDITKLSNVVDNLRIAAASQALALEKSGRLEHVKCPECGAVRDCVDMSPHGMWGIHEFQHITFNCIVCETVLMRIEAQVSITPEGCLTFSRIRRDNSWADKYYEEDTNV